MAELPRHARERPKAAFAVWVREHPGVPLPRKVSALVELTGCTADQIKCYLSARRKETRERLKALPPLKGKGLVLLDREGKELELDSCKAYRFAIDHWSIEAWIVADGRKCLIGDLEDFERRVR